MGLEQLPRRLLGGIEARSASPAGFSFSFFSPSFVSQRKIGDYRVHSVLSCRKIPFLTSASSRASSIHLIFLVIVSPPSETLRGPAVSVFLFDSQRLFFKRKSL